MARSGIRNAPWGCFNILPAGANLAGAQSTIGPQRHVRASDLEYGEATDGVVGREDAPVAERQAARF
jgi:hypothetical protein